MSEENSIEKSGSNTVVPVGILRINMEHKIAAGIFVLLFTLYGMAYFFQPEPKKELFPSPKSMSETAGEGEGEYMESTTIYHIGPAPL